MRAGLTGRASAVAAGLALWLATLTLMASAATALGTATFRDNFAAVSFNGNDGSENWSGSWVEFGESDGAGSGKVRVQGDSRCASGNCGYLSGSGSTSAGIYRVADLSDATAATLTYSYRRVKIGNSAAVARVSVSSNGGSSWSTIAAYSLDTSDASQNAVSVGISSWVSADTAIRFRIESSPGQGGRFYFDNVQISAELPDPPTTTTSQPPTTTTTTTTQPPTTTTTTTTTVPPGPTTTTTTTTTTTVPPGTTTTTTSTSQPPGTTIPPPPTTLLPPDPTRPTTTAPQPPSTSIIPPSTTEGPQALPPSAGTSVRPPFPIDLSAGAGFVGPGNTVAISADLEFAASNSDVSSLVFVALGEPIAARDGAALRSATGPAVGGIVYLWPGLSILAILGLVALVRPSATKRPTK